MSGLVLASCGEAASHSVAQPVGAGPAHTAAPLREAAPAPIVRESAGFTLRVLPATGFDAGRLGEPALQVEQTAAGDTAVSVTVTGAQGLKALYLEIGYDPAHYDPLSAAPTTVLADSADAGADATPTDRTLTLNVLSQPGTVAVNQVLTLPLAQPGFSGEGTLARALFAHRPFTQRQASAAPVTPKSAAVVYLNNLSRTLTWSYHSQGDYDQNGETNGSDLTPIALHYKVNTNGAGAFNDVTIESAVDGDDNGEINGADIQAIAQNYKRVVAGYHVYASLNQSDVPLLPTDASTIAPLDTVQLTAAVGDPRETRVGFSYDFSTLDDLSYVWVRAFDGATEGTPSNALQYVAVGPPAGPQANLTVSPEGGKPPLEVTFDASGSTDGGGSIVKYEWDFNGDGVYEQTGTEATTTYTYQSEGSFSPQVRVTDDSGLTASTFAHVYSSLSAISPIAVVKASRRFGEVSFTDNFDASASHDPDGSIVKYEWDWDYDGITFTPDQDTGATPTASHEFTTVADVVVAVRVTDNDGAPGIGTVNVKVYPAGDYNPVALLLAKPRYGPAPLNVTYDATGSYDIDGDIVSYDWDWDGDGTYELTGGTSATAAHVFNTPGVYNTTLRVTDNEGFKGTKIMLALVTANSSFPPADSTFALPSQSRAHDGDVVTIEVYSKSAANPFLFMVGSGVTVPAGNTYVPNTLNIGSISFDPTDQSPDGVWSLMNPNGGFLLLPDNFIAPADIGSGLARYDFTVAPLNGSNVQHATGAMYNFALTVHSNVTLGFQQATNPQKRTYYASDAMEFYWGNESNSGLPGIALQ